MSASPARRLLLLVVPLLLLAGLLAAGLVRIRDGETGLVRRGDGSVRVLEAGLRFVFPGSGPVQRAPRVPRPYQASVEARTPEGSALAVDVDGSFALRKGGETAWSRFAGEAPFFDALNRALAERLSAALAAGFPIASLGDESRLPELTMRLGIELEALGVTASGLALRLPLERNPVLASLRNREIVSLARRTGRRIVVVGWDGADWMLARPLLDAGRLPNLAKLMGRGVAADLRSEPPLLSPLLWTTIATGKPVLEHGIADFIVLDPKTGARIPITSASRKVHALWTILPSFGLKIDTVAWWASWPAEPTSGTLVSDRVAYQLFDIQDTGDAGKVHPPEAWPKVRAHVKDPAAITCESMRRFVPLDCADLERRWQDATPENRQKDRVNHLRKILATTDTYHAIVLDLLGSQADLTLAYYELTDTVGHLFGRFLPPKLPGVTDEEVRLYGKALPEAYVYADELLGELVARASPDTTFLLISDHGFYVGDTRPRTDTEDFGAGAPNWHRQTGVLVAAGPAVERGNWRGATIFDVAPTVLHWLGLPVPKDMPGRVLPDGGGGDDRRLASYEALHRERGATQVAADPAADAERIRELVALGYLSPNALPEASSPAAGAAPAPAVGAPGAAAGTPAVPGVAADGASVGLATETYNLGRIHQRRGEYAEAEKQFRLTIERAPEFGQGWASLAQIAALRGDHATAFRTLDQGLHTTTDMPPSGLTGLVDEARDAGLLAEAAKTLQWLAGTQYSRQSAFHAAWGLYYEGAGDKPRALGAYRNSLKIDPLDQLAIERTIALLREKGDVAGAHAVLDASLAKAQGSMGALNHLALVSLREGMPDRAEKMFRDLLRGDPSNPGLLSNLSAALARQGKNEEAIRTMRQAIEHDPDNAQNHFNLGALLVERGQTADAQSEFEAAERFGLKNPRVYVAISKTRFRNGDPAGAEAALRQSLALDPTHAESRELLQILLENR